MGRYLRLVWRIFAFGSVLVVHAFTYLLNPANRRSIAGKADWLHRICVYGLRAIGIRWTASGSLPTGQVIVGNHVSYVDILVLSSCAPVVFVAKKEVQGWPVFGWFAQLSGTRFIDRKRRGDVARVADDIPSALNEAVSVVLFLEGTSSDGSRVLPFKASLLEPAVRDQRPVVPVAIAYRVPPGHSASQEVCWWGDMTLVPHLLNLFSLPYVEARVSFGQPILPEQDRKAFAARLNAEVSRLHADLLREI